MPNRSSVLVVMSVTAYVSVTAATAVLPALSTTRDAIVWSPAVGTSIPRLHVDQSPAVAGCAG